MRLSAITAGLNKIEKPKATMSQGEMGHAIKVGTAWASETESGVFFTIRATYVWDPARRTYRKEEQL